LLAATVANLTLIAGKVAQTGRGEGAGGAPRSLSTLAGAVRRLTAGLKGAVKQLIELARPIADASATLLCQPRQRRTSSSDRGARQIKGFPARLLDAMQMVVGGL